LNHNNNHNNYTSANSIQMVEHHCRQILSRCVLAGWSITVIIQGIGIAAIVNVM